MDWFSITWLGAVGFTAYWQWAWFWRGYKSGIATIYFRYEFSKDEKPFEFRMIQLGRIFGLIVTVIMFVFGLRFMVDF